MIGAKWTFLFNQETFNYVIVIQRSDSYIGQFYLLIKCYINFTFVCKYFYQMKLVRVMSDEFLSTFDASANLYKKYQMVIHNDPPEECNQKSFFNFLVKSPLQVHFVFNRFVLISNNI